jgi:hypothetical protein
MIIAVTYSQDKLPSLAHLAARINALITKYPLLSSKIVEKGQGQYFFEPRYRPWTSDEILLEVDTPTTLAHALEEETVRLNEISFEHDPAWRVVRYTAGEPHTNGYLLVWSDHTITDGRGLTRMVTALIDDTDQSLPSDPNAPARMDRHADFQIPSIKPKAIELRDYSSALPTWPRGRIHINPMKAPSATSLLTVSATVVAKIKDEGRRHGVPTLHALLNAVWLVALWATFRQEDLPFAIETGSPRSERAAQPDGLQAWCTANYVSLFSCTATLSPSTRFWDLASDMSNALRSQEGILQGRQKIGALGRISNDPVVNREGTTISGWEAYLIESASTDVAYKEGLQVSNLGFFDLPKDAENIVWKMNPSPFGPAVTVQLIGHRNGLGVSTAWREGSVVCQKEMDHVQAVVNIVLERLADDTVQSVLLEELAK